MIVRIGQPFHPRGDGPVRLIYPLYLAITLTAVGGCATSRQHESFAPHVIPGQRGVIVSVDGAGGFDALTNSLQQAVDADCLPFAVAMFDWSHGYYRILSDQMDYCHARAQGQRLACEVLALRQRCPAGQIHLIGHSAGCHVILAAADFLPPNSVDQIVLLAPSVSADYDLRRALCCSSRGIDVF